MGAGPAGYCEAGRSRLHPGGLHGEGVGWGRRVSRAAEMAVRGKASEAAGPAGRGVVADHLDDGAVGHDLFHRTQGGELVDQRPGR